jgi:hypothetical protein
MAPPHSSGRDAEQQHAAGGEPSATGSAATVVYARGPVAGLPEEHASRRERFAELDSLQPGWQVELRSRGAGGTVDAVFFTPAGTCMHAKLSWE